jgi:hypothetical protein
VASRERLGDRLQGVWHRAYEKWTVQQGEFSDFISIAVRENAGKIHLWCWEMSDFRGQMKNHGPKLQ